MSFQQGLSGLSSSSKTLDAIGNNIANSATVGFKSASARFADVYANSLAGGGGGTQTGIGVKVTEVAQQFNQGNITASANPLDMAINGGGFFRMNHLGTITYARNGQFQLNKDGYLVNPNGDRLTGYIANSLGQVSTGSPADLLISAVDLPPSQTTGVLAQLNLDSRSVPPVTSPFDPADPTTYNNATSITVFDSLGNSHVLQTYYVNTAPGAWDIYGTYDDGSATVPTAPAVIGSLTFSPTGAISSPVPPLPATFSTDLVLTTGATTPMTVDVNWTGTTQFGSTFSVNALSQDGYTSGRLAGFTTASDGTISGSYTNGQTAVLGQVVLANFRNPNGLLPNGNNTWSESNTSGAPLVGVPGTGSLGILQAAATEDSNVDLTAELVNMITAQRVYQANAQTIKTQDQILQTLVNLR
ncbi:flagellar hook protein FlgE [soil metagenome]